MQETRVQSLGLEDPLEEEGSVLGSGRSPGGGGFSPWVWRIPWRRERQPTPVFLPGEPCGQGVWWAIVQGSQSQTQIREYSNNIESAHYSLNTSVKKWHQMLPADPLSTPVAKTQTETSNVDSLLFFVNFTSFVLICCKVTWSLNSINSQNIP